MPTGAPLRRGAPLIGATAYHVIVASSSATLSSFEANGGEETQQKKWNYGSKPFFNTAMMSWNWPSASILFFWPFHS